MTETLGIGAVAERLGIATSALRFYEERGLISSIRSAGGQRRFPREVIRRVAFIRAAQRVGLSLEAIGDALDELPHDHAPDREDWARVASSWRPMLDDRIRALELLRDRLDGCIGCGCLSLDTCELYNPGDVASARGPGPRYLLGDSP